jgi:hypothetical protein
MNAATNPRSRWISRDSPVAPRSAGGAHFMNKARALGPVATSFG